MSLYQIGGVAVNNRTDYKHQLFPGAPASRREETFPGIGEVLVVKGVQLPPTLMVISYVEGTGVDAEAALQALMTALETQKAREASTSIVTVSVHGRDFENCDLQRFETVGRIEPVAVSGSFKVRQLCRWTWRQVRS